MKIVRKSGTLLLVYSLCFLHSNLYAQDTLRHITKNAQLEAYKYYGEFVGLPLWGYVTGHNALTDLEYAEKYDIEGNAKVQAVISYHKGTSTSSEKEVSFNIYEVDNDGLPGNQLATKVVKHTHLKLDSTATLTTFDNPVDVSQSFFVSFQLADYMHDPSVLGKDTLVLLTSVDGSRNQQDRDVYGRNVLRLHSLPNVYNWEDFGTENYRQLQFHLAIFPVVQFDNANALQENYVGTNNGIKFYNLYPNPSRTDFINVDFELSFSTNVSFLLMDVAGHEIRRKALENLMPGRHKLNFNIEGIPNGNYFLLLIRGGQRLGQQITINHN